MLQFASSVDSVLEGVADEFRLVVQLELGQGVADVVLHGAGGQGEPLAICG